MNHTLPSAAPVSPVLWLAHVTPNDLGAIGQKAARLAGLLAGGFPVPLGFCVTSLAYAQHAARTAHQPTTNASELSPALVAALAEHYQRLQSVAPGPVAVRSSALAEDLDQHSFAGLYDTVLDVADFAGMLAALRHCWASYMGQAAALYRERAGVRRDQQGMAVLVQTMIPARWAGVLFTRDPRDERPNALVIESVAGAGEALVSGQARAERHWVDRATQQPLEPSSTPALLDEHRLKALAALGLSIERQQGCAQDIEWALDAQDRLWVLQTRPITQALDGWGSPWELPNREWLATYDEPFSPLGSDLAVRRYDVWVEGINALCHTRFQPERHVANGGFIYYRPTWRSRSRPLRLWMQFWQLAAFLNSGRVQQRFTQHILPRHQQWLATADQAEPVRLNDEAVLAAFDAAIDHYLTLQFSSYAIGRVAVTAANLLERVCQRWFSGSERVQALDLLSGLEDSSVQRELALYRLGRLLAETVAPSLLADLTLADLEGWQQQTGSRQRFWAELQGFIDEYGYSWADRYPRDPAWQLNPAALTASLVNAARTPPEEGFDERHRRQQRRRLQAIGRARERLASGLLAWRRLVFDWLLQRAEALFPFKEDRNHDVYRAAMVIQKYAREIGRRLAVRRLVPAAADVFFLEWDEIKALWAAERPPAELQRKLAQRKGRFEAGRWHLARRRNDTAAAPAAGATAPAGHLELAGDACSPGIVVGRARLVRSLGELQRVGPGDILVCGQLRPAWSQVFARAGGAVIELGSLLSHGSTLAREYGIPAVINIAGVTDLIADGDTLMVDGSRGRVVVAPGDAAWRPERLPTADNQPYAHPVRD